VTLKLLRRPGKERYCEPTLYGEKLPEKLSSFQGVLGQSLSNHQHIPVAVLSRLATRPRAEKNYGHQAVSERSPQGCYDLVKNPLLMICRHH